MCGEGWNVNKKIKNKKFHRLDKLGSAYTQNSLGAAFFSLGTFVGFGFEFLFYYVELTDEALARRTFPPRNGSS